MKGTGRREGYVISVHLPVVVLSDEDEGAYLTSLTRRCFALAVD